MVRDKKTWCDRVLAIFLAAVLCFVAFPISAKAETPAEKYERLKGELEEIQAQIDATKNDLAAAQEYYAHLLQEQEVLQEMITLNESELQQAGDRLSAKEQEIEEKRRAIHENDQMFRERLVALYMCTTDGTIQTLLSTDNMADLIVVTDTLRRISQNDVGLLNTLAEQRETLEIEQGEIDQLIQELWEYQEELETNRQTLADNIAAQEQLVGQTESLLAQQQASEDDKAAEAEAAYQAMLAISNNMPGSSQGDGSEYVGGAFVWPLPNHFNITCHFGAPDPTGKPHLGLDVSAPAGTNIVAAGSGTVIRATWDDSYGNYMIIDHGGGVKTLYAHCTAFIAGVNDTVAAGDAIATVGTTGFSTGNHLHFEVHDPGRQNPLNYLRG